ncbi:MAG: hypothetical protein JWM98_2094, partial [Thermoleophilia bacterium]|nr:hypothetical protein [Thermoleophilia bacterium]
MSASISSCCTPCAAAPVYTPAAVATDGGGAPMKDATGGGGTAPVTAPDPQPVTSAPAPSAQPVAPTDVTGGGPVVTGGGATTYEAPQPTQCGQWVPAPVAAPAPIATTPAPAPAPTTGTDAPPEPITGPADTASTGTTGTVDGSAADASAVANGPATGLSTWPEWKTHFTNLGLSATEVDKLGAATLTNSQLAGIYKDIHDGIVEQGGVPGQAPTAPQPGTGQPAGASAWSPEWEQRFTALGLPKEFVAELKAQAEKTGATDEKLASVYQQLAEQAPGAQKPGATDPTQPTQPAPANDAPGWNPQFEAAFTKLGMPKEVVKLYAESGAPASGLEAAYKHAAGRVQDFTDRGWMQKCIDAKVPALDMWTAILGDQPVKDEDADKLVETAKGANLTTLQKGLKLGASFFPGGRLVQWAFGKEAISGEKIDRFDPMQLGFAALSGLALFASIRGAKNISGAMKLRSGGYAELTKAGLSTQGQSLTDAAMGATQTWGLKQKLMTFIPGTKLHREIVGLGHAEVAAKAFNNGGAAKLMADADGALQVSTLSQMFDDIKTGATKIQGGKIGYLGNFKKGAPMTLAAGKGGTDVINVAKNLTIGDGRSQIAAMLEVGGQKLGNNPDWLKSAPSLVDNIAGRSDAELGSLGRLMAGNAVSTLGIGKDGMRPVKYLTGLTKGGVPDWYATLAAATAKEFPGLGQAAGGAAGVGGVAAISDELLEALAGHKLFTGLFDEAGANIAALDRSALSPETAGLVDDATKAMEESRGLLDAAKTGGVIDDAARNSVQHFGEAVGKLHDADPELATKLFPSYVDGEAFMTAEAEAVSTVKAAYAAEAAAKAAEAAKVAEAAAPAAGEVAEVAAGGADEAAAVVEGAAKTAPVAAAPVAEAAAPAAASSVAPITTTDVAAGAAATVPTAP